jgi:hypothetical protein
VRGFILDENTQYGTRHLDLQINVNEMVQCVKQNLDAHIMLDGPGFNYYGPDWLAVIDAFEIPNGVWVTIGICLWTSRQQGLHDAQADGRLDEGASLFEVNNYVSPTFPKGYMEELVETLQEMKNYDVQVNKLYADHPV